MTNSSELLIGYIIFAILLLFCLRLSKMFKEMSSEYIVVKELCVKCSDSSDI